MPSTDHSFWSMLSSFRPGSTEVHLAVRPTTTPHRPHVAILR